MNRKQKVRLHDRHRDRHAVTRYLHWAKRTMELESAWSDCQPPQKDHGDKVLTPDPLFVFCELLPVALLPPVALEETASFRLLPLAKTPFLRPRALVACPVLCFSLTVVIPSSCRTRVFEGGILGQSKKASATNAQPGFRNGRTGVDDAVQVSSALSIFGNGCTRRAVSRNGQ